MRGTLGERSEFIHAVRRHPQHECVRQFGDAVQRVRMAIYDLVQRAHEIAAPRELTLERIESCLRASCQNDVFATLH